MMDLTTESVAGKGDMPTTKVEQILERMRLATNTLTNKALSESLGLDAQATTNAKKKGNVPPVWLIRVAELTNYSVDWLLYGTGPMKRRETTLAVMSHAMLYDVASDKCLSPEDFRTVPLLEGWVAAGPAGEIIYGEIADHYPFKRWWIERLVGRSPDRLTELFLIKVRGTSMSPTINQGEIILVDTHESERLEIRTGHIYVVVQPDGSIVLKRLALSERAGHMRLICMSDNVADYKPFDFELETGKSILEYVLGRVRWCGKEFD